MKRVFHIVYTLLALNFILPVFVYVLAPEHAVHNFGEIGRLFGVPYAHTEDSVLWRVLGIANVATLGFCCVLLQLDLKRYYAALWPLLFLKSAAAVGFGITCLFEWNPAYLAACLFDGLTVTAMYFFASRALRTLP